MVSNFQMLRRRVTLASFHSLGTLSKVCRSSNSINNFDFLRNLSTASERLDFDYSNGLNGGLNQNPNGNYGQSQNDIGNNGQFRWDSDGGYGERRVQQQPNSVGAHGEIHGNGKQQGPARKDSFLEDDKFVSNFRKGIQHDGDLTSEYTRYGHRGEFRHGASGNKSNFGSGSTENLARNLNGFQLSPDNQYGGLATRDREGHGGDFRSRQDQNFTRRNFENFEEKSNGFHQISDTKKDNSNFHIGEHHRGEFQQGQGSRSTDFGRGSNESMRRHSSVDVQNPKPWQQSGKNSSGFNTLGAVKAQPYLNGSFEQDAMESTVGYYGTHGAGQLQNAGHYELRNIGVSQKIPQNYSPISSQNFEQPQVNYNEIYGRMNQQGHNVGILKQDFQNYTARSTGNFPQTQGHNNEGNVGMHQQLANGINNQNGEITEDGGNVKFNGTLEEFDLFLKEGKLKVVMQILDLLEKQGIPVDLPRYLSLMKVCGEDTALEEGKSTHKHLVKSVPNLEVSTYNKILEMYLECGSVGDAFSVFDNMRRSLSSWDIMITGLVKNDHAEAAIDLFTEFKELGLKPDDQIYLGIFSACSALFDPCEGMLHFESMVKDHGIVPSMKHYASMVDMLGSAGHLDEALEFTEKMPVEPSVEVWETLMNLFRVHGHLNLGDRCAELVELLDPSRLSEQSRAGLVPVKTSDLSKEKEKEKKKLDGQSPLAMRMRVHEYRAGDRSHPDHEKLYSLLGGLKHQMKEAGYHPETKFVLHDIDQESKEEALMSHSERLAVARGLLNTPARTTMRVIKNLRVCADCHNAMKIVANLVGREFIMRDAKRFHHFKDGVCSCRDYW